MEINLQIENIKLIKFKNAAICGSLFLQDIISKKKLLKYIKIHGHM